MGRETQWSQLVQDWQRLGEIVRDFVLRAAVRDVANDWGVVDGALADGLNKATRGQRWVIAIQKKSITKYITNYFYTK